jgi:hypothetical protein
MASKLLATIGLGFLFATVASAQSLLSPDPIISSPAAPDRSFKGARPAASGPSIISAEKACDLAPDHTDAMRKTCTEEEQKYIEFAAEHWARLSAQQQVECNDLANQDHFGEHNEVLARCVDKYETQNGKRGILTR